MINSLLTLSHHKHIWIHIKDIDGCFYECKYDTCNARGTCGIIRPNVPGQLCPVDNSEGLKNWEKNE